MAAQACSDEFSGAAYHHFIDRYSCCGSKEIGIAIPRTREEPGDLFRLQIVDGTKNQIFAAAQRKEEERRRLCSVFRPAVIGIAKFLIVRRSSGVRPN